MLRYYRQVPQKKKIKGEEKRKKGKRNKKRKREKERQINGPRRQTFAFEFSRNIALDWTPRKKGETS